MLKCLTVRRVDPNRARFSESCYARHVSEAPAATQDCSAIVPFWRPPIARGQFTGEVSWQRERQALRGFEKRTDLLGLSDQGQIRMSRVHDRPDFMVTQRGEVDKMQAIVCT
jgi:hypothetical protein